MFVDDDPGVRIAICHMIGKIFSGCHVEQASDGTEATEKLMAVSPQVVILDLRLPNMSGLDVCRLIQGQPKLSKTRVLVITGFPSSEIQQEVFQNGVCEYLTKPFKVKELAGSIRRLLN